jgi:hypothetical protein
MYLMLSLQYCVLSFHSQSNPHHFIVCTWCFNFSKYHDLIIGCVGSIQQILLICLPLSVHERTLLVLMKWPEVHQLGPMVGTPYTLEMGYGQ